VPIIKPQNMPFVNKNNNYIPLIDNYYDIIPYILTGLFMLFYLFSEDDYLEAEKRVASLPIYKNSHRGVKANQVGVMGELLAEIWFTSNGIDYYDEKCTQYDYRLSNNETIDVKTKDRTVKPRANFDCSIPLYNHAHQKPDYYLYISLIRSKQDNTSDIRRYKGAYIMGASDQHMLVQQGVTWKKDQVDPSNGTKFWTDCINIKQNELFTVSQSAQHWQSISPQNLKHAS
jgi:hypothetical protein